MSINLKFLKKLIDPSYALRASEGRLRHPSLVDTTLKLRTTSEGRLRLQSRRGFTLIELMICIAVFSIILIVTTQSIILITKKAGLARIKADTNENARFTIETIKRELRESPGFPAKINCNNSICIYRDSADTKNIKVCLFNGQIYKIDNSDTVLTCPVSVLTPTITNSDIIYINSLQFMQTAATRYYNITINYTDSKGVLCNKQTGSVVDPKCVNLNSGIVIRNQ